MRSRSRRRTRRGSMANRLIVLAVSLLVAVGPATATAAIKIPSYASPRVHYGIDQLERALRDVNASDDGIVVRLGGDSSKREGFTLTAATDGSIVVIGNDDSGILYGCLELARRVRAAGEV